MGSSGQLGTGALADHEAPVTVRGLSGAKTIGAGSDFACARLRSRTVRCWGDNHDGELGNGETGYSTTPVSVSGLS
jgi:alpha-tubulin suppressor-like RCC1 family protein